MLIAQAAALALLFAPAARAESVEMTTYYPAPVGVYQRITTTDKTVLARDGGNVGIGVLAPARKLEVAGDAAVQSMILTPLDAAPTSPAEGMIYYNKAESHLYLRSENAWKRVLVFGGSTLGSTTLGGDYTFTNSNVRIMQLNFKTTKRGLVAIEWTGTATIAAGANQYSIVTVRRCGSTLIQSATLDDEDDSAATVEPNDIGGSTMLQLAANTSYCFTLIGHRKGAGNTTILKGGATMSAEELFAF